MENQLVEESGKNLVGGPFRGLVEKPVVKMRKTQGLAWFLRLILRVSRN